jgi:hypothetical protein
MCRIGSLRSLYVYISLIAVGLCALEMKLPRRLARKIPNSSSGGMPLSTGISTESGLATTKNG